MTTDPVNTVVSSLKISLLLFSWIYHNIFEVEMSKITKLPKLSFGVEMSKTIPI